MAAHAVVESGGMPRIFSKKRPSRLFGAQYLHKPITGVTDEAKHVTVEYLLRGTPEDYRRRVYGQSWDGKVSPEDYGEDHQAWDIRETYSRLYEKYQHYIMDVEVDANGLRNLIADRSINIIVNTIPLPSLCYRGHIFRGTKINAAGDAPDLGIDVGTIYQCPPNTVICNGEEAPSWYRISNIFDHTTVEWPQSIKPVIGSYAEVIKPTEHNCDCWPELMNVGRYGSWTKGVLSHTAYDRVLERMADGEAAAAARYNDPNVPTLW
jgi:hypothetical protein